jgi:hypothetical protein
MDEEMDVIDFHGVLEDDGQDVECDSLCMTKADVKVLIDEVESAFRHAEKQYDSFIKSGNIDDMRAALDTATYELRNGRYKDIATKNPWLKKGNDYLTRKDGSNNFEDREAVLSAYRLATKASDVMNAVCAHIDYFNRVYLLKASEFISFDRDMHAVVTGDYLANIDKCCHEYNYFISKFNRGKFLSDIEGVSKDKPFDENLKLVTEQMNYEISVLNNLKGLLSDSTHVNPSAVNMFYVVDRITREYEELESELKTGGDIFINGTNKHIAEIEALMGQHDYFIVRGLFHAVIDLLTKLDFVFMELGEILKKYDSSQDAPYAIMQYSSNVKDTAEKKLFMSLGNPKKGGTKYNELAREMVSRNRELAQNVAKMAP